MIVRCSHDHWSFFLHFNIKATAMKDKISSLRKTARVAGALYLVTIFTTLYAHLFVPSKLYVRGDAVATSTNILAHEALFRTCVVVGMGEAVVVWFLALVLYRLFRQVDDTLSKAMVGLAGAQVPVALILATCKISALAILKGVAPGVSPGELPMVAMLFLKFNEYGTMALEMVDGLWLLLLGLLVYRCRFIPRFLSVLLGIAGLGYTGIGLLFMLAPSYTVTMSVMAVLFWALAEFPIMVWFLLRGVKEYLSITVEALSPVSTLGGTLKESLE